ncbi:hypothetical protein N9137_00775 [Pseudomonadales bacterium]|nr:hypothetical protein [Pseudomonadales bacterium]
MSTKMSEQLVELLEGYEHEVNKSQSSTEIAIRAIKDRNEGDVLLE